ncbi:MAG: methionyl-tRNA formyltransferase [Terriglobia bacterium]|jgi:methionyl-tRNA formyltransferase
MKLIFCGTPQFAVPALERLIADKHEIDLVMTNPDEPSGRGYETRPSPVKQAAVRAGLEVFQPTKLKDEVTVAFLSKFQPDFIVVVAYGHIIPPWMIDLPKQGCINLHASLLPKYRGAAPIQWAIMRGESVTGVTTMKIDEGLDTGDILLRREVPIEASDTTETLSERLSGVGAELMAETLGKLSRGEIQPQPQDHSRATLAPILKKEDGRIAWTFPAEEIAWRVRGLRPWPGAYTSFRSKNLHIWSAAPAAGQVGADDQPGTLFPERGSLRVACGQGTLLELLELQLEGRKRLPARDFVNGMRPGAGERLGGK